GLARLDVFELYAPCSGPIDNCRAQVFGTVIAPNGQGLSSPANDLLERANHTLRRQREVDLDAQRLAVKVIDHVQHSDATSIGKLVMHEVHRPHLVDLGRYRQRLGRLPNQPFARFDPQVQFELAVDPVHTLVVPPEAADITQVQKAQPKAPVAVVVRQAKQPVCDLLVLGVDLGDVPIAGLANAERLASHPDRYAVIFHGTSGHLAAARWPHHFFSSASVTISALSFSSTYILRRRAFSASSSFIRAIIDTSMPPYFDRHL